MKKGLVFAISMLFIAPIFAEECAASDGRVIQYKVTMYRDENCDSDAWQKMSNDARRAVSCGQTEDGENAISAVVTGLQAVAAGAKGIHGEISVSLSSGEECSSSKNCEGMSTEECKQMCSQTKTEKSPCGDEGVCSKDAEK